MDQDQFLNIVMVHCEGGDMYNKIRNCKGKNFPESVIMTTLMTDFNRILASFGLVCSNGACVVLSP